MMSTAAAAATSSTETNNYRFQKNDNIFVKIGKESHPATFIEYYNSNDKEARIRFSASSAVAMVKLNQLELMEKTTKRRHTPKSTETKHTAAHIATVANTPHDTGAAIKKRRARESTAAKFSAPEKFSAPHTAIVANSQHEMSTATKKPPTDTVAKRVGSYTTTATTTGATSTSIASPGNLTTLATTAASVKLLENHRRWRSSLVNTPIIV